jgi:hypothetical protein
MPSRRNSVHGAVDFRVLSSSDEPVAIFPSQHKREVKGPTGKEHSHEFNVDVIHGG